MNIVYLLLFFFARSGIIKPSEIRIIGVIMFIAVWNGLPGVYIPVIQANAVRKKHHAPKPIPTYLFLTNLYSDWNFSAAFFKKI